MIAVVTGGAGFIGRHLCIALAESGNRVISIDDYSRGDTINHIPGVRYIDGNTVNITSLMEGQLKPDVVFHLGEQSRVTPSFDHIDKYHESCMVGTFSVLQYCSQNDIKLVYGASSSIFSRNGKYDSPYSFFKGVNAELIECYGRWYGLRYSITFFYNVFGDHLAATDIDSVINVFVDQYKKGDLLTIVSPGTQSRSYTHVSDIVAGLIAAWKESTSDIYHLGQPDTYTLFDVVQMFPDANYTLVPERPGDRHNGGIPDLSTTQKLNWAPTIRLHDWINDNI